MVFFELRQQGIGGLDLPFLDVGEQVRHMVGDIGGEAVGVEHVEDVLGPVGLHVGQVRQTLHCVPHGVGAEVERQAVVAFVAVGVGDGLEVEGLGGVGLHGDGQGLGEEDLAAEHGQQVLLGVAELSGVSREAESQQTKVVLGGHLPTYLLAASRDDFLHLDDGVGDDDVDGFHGDGVEHLEFGLRGDGFIAGVDDIGHKPQLVGIVHVTRHVGHDHHRLGGLEGVFLAAGLVVLGVGDHHQLPAGDGIGQSERESAAAIGFGTEVGEEEGGLVEVLAESRFDLFIGLLSASLLVGVVGTFFFVRFFDGGGTGSTIFDFIV